MSDLKRKKLSGHMFKKRRLAKQVEQKQLSGSLSKFVLPSTSTTSANNPDNIGNTIKNITEVIDEEIERRCS